MEEVIDLRSLFAKEQIEDTADEWTAWAWQLNNVLPADSSYLGRVRRGNEMLAEHDELDNEEQDPNQDPNQAGGSTSEPKLYNLDELQERRKMKKDEMFHDDWSLANENNGNKLMSKGKHELASELYTRAIEHQSIDGSLFFNRSIAFQKMNMFKLALIDAARTRPVRQQSRLLPSSWRVVYPDRRQADGGQNVHALPGLRFQTRCVAGDDRQPTRICEGIRLLRFRIR